MSRTSSTSLIQRELIQAKGHRGSNQKSALLKSCTSSTVSGAQHSRMSGTGTAFVRRYRASERMPGMPGTNLTRDEAATRARAPRRRLLHRGPRPDRVRQGLRDHHRDLRSPAPSPAARRSPTWSARRSTRSRSTAGARPSEHYQDNRISAARPRRPRTSCASAADCPYTPHRRGAPPLRGPGRRAGLPLHAVRGPRRPPGLHHLRAARPEGGLHVHRDRARRTGRSSPTPPTPAPEDLGAGKARVAGSRRPSGCRRTSPRSWPVSTTRVDDVYEGKHGEIPLGHYCRQSLVEHLDTDEVLARSPSRASSSSRRPSTTPTRSASTTSSTCRSTTWARWRTPAAVTCRDEYLPRSRQDPLLLRVARQR